MADWMDFIQQVKSANDIVAVISSYIDVSMRGQNFWARCPFHGEKTPSFSISRRGFFKCFGCGESGDVITFVQKYESCTFYEAVEILAKRANLEMPATASNVHDEELNKRKKNKDTYLNIIRDTARFYYRCYRADVGKNARQYMTKRGFSDSTVNTFGIGYSPDMNMLARHLSAQGYSMDNCVKAGVLSTKNNNNFYDAMSGRLIVPIIDINGKPIAFGGRALDERTSQYGKYKNTSETSVFIKTNNLYAINIAKASKQGANLPYIIMVEGYMDVIAMYQAGFPQCVASMGTSLTTGQAKLISRLVDKVYICYDGDSAGQKATIRGLDILSQEGLEVLVMSVPSGLDPDEYIGKYGRDAFVKLIDNALPLVDYKLDILEKHYDIFNTNESVSNSAKVKYVSACVNVLKSLSDVEQQRYIEVVANKSGYSVEYLARKMSTEEQEPVFVVSEQLSAEQTALYDILSFQLAGHAVPLPSVKLTTDDDRLRAIIDYIYQCHSDNIAVQVDMIYTLCPDQDKNFYYRLTKACGVELTDKDNLYYDECVQVVMFAQLRTKKQQLTNKLKSISQEDNEYRELLRQISQVNIEIDKLQNNTK